MTPVAELERSGARRAPLGEGRTLQDVIACAWEELAAHRTAACPICDGPMEPRYGAGPAVVAARCRACGAELR